MKPAPKPKAKPAFTLLEVLVVIALLLLLGVFFIPSVNPWPSKANRVVCMTNQKQIGLGLIMYSSDYGCFPWGAATNFEGATEIIARDTAADYLVTVKNYLPQPRLFVCPTDPQRKPAATNFAEFSNSNLSYFVSLDAARALLATSGPVAFILTGDRHLASDQRPVPPGRFSVTNAAVMTWTRELHYVKDAMQPSGVLVFADGHAEAVQGPRLPQMFQAQALTTNQLVIP